MRKLVHEDSLVYLGRDKVRGFGPKFGVQHYAIAVFHGFEREGASPRHMVQTISFSSCKSLLVHFDPGDLPLWEA